MTFVLSLAALIFVADQLTKRAALVQLNPTRPVVVIPDFFHLVLVMNPGVAFGIFAGVPPRWRWIVTLFSLTALVLLASLAFRVLPRGSVGARMAIGLVFGGAAGNLLDRWRFGAVVDFIDVFWRGYHWPAFNVADSAISVGVAIMILDMLGSDHASKTV